MSRALVFSRELTPSVATLHRVFSRLDVEDFEKDIGWVWAWACLYPQSIPQIQAHSASVVRLLSDGTSC